MGVGFLGLCFDDELGLEEVSERVIKSDRIYLVTPNIDHVVSYHDRRDCSYRDAIANATMILCDSRVLKLASKLFYRRKIQNVVPGSTLTEYLFRKKISQLGKVGIVGGCPGDLSKLQSKYGGKFLFQNIPSYGFIESKDEVDCIVKKLIKQEFDSLFICVGSPQQEILAAKIFSQKERGRLFCVGASIDFLLGRQKRAPEWVQNFSLEWLYRFFSSPKKMFKRYFCRDIKIIGILFRFRGG